MWKHSPAARVPTAFLVLPNFHSCFYLTIRLWAGDFYRLFFSSRRSEQRLFPHGFVGGKTKTQRRCRVFVSQIAGDERGMVRVLSSTGGRNLWRTGLALVFRRCRVPGCLGGGGNVSPRLEHAWRSLGSVSLACRKYVVQVRSVQGVFWSSLCNWGHIAKFLKLGYTRGSFRYTEDSRTSPEVLRSEDFKSTRKFPVTREVSEDFRSMSEGQQNSISGPYRVLLR